ncbi:MAG: ketoacyl-ACP synthase III, partial [Pirellulaceae bacterium]
MSSTVHTHSSSPEPGDSSDRPAESRKVQPSGRSPLAVVTGAQILSTGCFAPAEVVRNEDLSELGFDADWIVQRTGIRERRRAAEGIVTSD